MNREAWVAGGRKGPPPEVMSFSPVQTFLALAFGIILLGIFRVVGMLLASGFELIKRTFGSHPAELIVAIGVLAVGIFMYWLRERHVIKYAIIELAFAFATAWHSAENYNKDIGNYTQITTWLGLSAAAYLVVRGCDNLMKGMTKIKDAKKKNTKTE